MIRADLHVHTRISKGQPFRMPEFERTIRHALGKGLDGFAAIEHFHANNFWDTPEILGRHYAYSKGHFTVFPGFNILSGAELTVADAADVVLLGPVDRLREFDQAFRPHLSEGNHPYFREVIKPAKELGLIMIGAHPTRPGKNYLKVDESLVAHLDALEINGKDVAKENAKNRVQQWAYMLRRPVVGGSDTHVWAQAGAQRTLLPGKELTFEALKSALKEHRTDVETVPHISYIVKMCETYKKFWKRNILAGLEPATFLKPEPLYLV